MILTGDIGGTNSRFAYFEANTPPRLVAEHTFASGEHTGIEHMLHLLAAMFPHTIDRACLAIAGPIRNQRCEATNLPWIVDGAEVSKALGGKPAWLMNDLEATAYGVMAMGAEDFAVLNPGDPGASGTACVIAAGTGLGEAGMYWDGAKFHPFAGEGGHTSFAPISKLQIELLQYLHQHHQHVSWERVLSGPGLLNLYHFFRDTRGGNEPDWLRQEMNSGDPAAAISRAALAGRNELCEQALDLFVALYGQEAGNAALKYLATGGVYLGGGIAPKILPKLNGPGFIGGFLAKGRMRQLLEAMPVRVILNKRAGLIGAAVRSQQLR